MPRPRFNRILLKLSGEALMGEGQFGIDPETVARLAGEIEGGQGRRPRAVPGGRRRQHLPRPGRRRQGLRPRQRRLYGHAGDGDERARRCRTRSSRSASTPASSRRSRWRPVCEPYIRRRADAAHGEGQGGDLRRRHRQSLLHHRHRRRAARRRNGLRRPVQGHQRRRRLRCRSQEGAERQALRTRHLQPGARPTISR